MIDITHFALSSLYATKIHACFFRRYAKGRDFYDLVWYLGKKVEPNYRLLNNAVKQTQGENPGLNSKNIADFLLGRIEKIDFRTAKADIERFLEDKNELKLLDGALISKSIIDAFTHAPESHGCEPVDEWLSVRGSAPRQSGTLKKKKPRL